MATTSVRLPFDDDQALDARIAARDADARARAVDPRFNVALEASAGTGKTRVLVDRYINLLRAGVDPENILAVTFTRKAAAEMRDRIMTTLRTSAARGEIPAARWRDLRDRTADIAVSTIDAFCLSLLREFPLEADLDPGFTVADDTVLPRLIEEALDATFRTCRAAARTDNDVALVLSHLGERRARAAISSLLDRRLVAPAVLTRNLSGTPKHVDAAAVSRAAGASLLRLLAGMRGGLDEFLRSGPLDAGFELLAHGLRQLAAAVTDDTIPAELVPVVFARARAYFLTQDRKPRSRSPHPQRVFANRADWQIHAALVVDHSEAFARLDLEYRRGLNVPLTRGLLRMFRIAERGYQESLEAHALLDFPALVLRALDLLRRMDEFSRSRYRLESRFHHVLVDEFQDTSRAQWEMVSLLIQSWGEGAGLSALGPLAPSVFIVGDRKQSIYGFRDADVSILRNATRQLEGLRPDHDVRRSISRSFRAIPPLLSFVNDVCQDMDRGRGSAAFEYDETDRFPVEWTDREQGDSLGLVLEATPEACAETVAAEIERLVATGTPVRDRDTGVPRAVRAGDIAILFRSRDSHREFEAALTSRGIPSYVYKGLGFFDADEIKDLVALIRYLADPVSNLRAAALLRSRFFGLSDEALRLLAPRIAEALAGDEASAAVHSLSQRDLNALVEARASTSRWRALVNRVGPAELVDQVLIDSAYAFELRGFRVAQARENLKKLRALLRRLQNHGYSTVGHVAAHLDRVSVGDESNATLDAVDSVNLMTVHASKGLEFPVVFVVNLCRGTGGRRNLVRWSSESDEEVPSVAVGEPDPDVDDSCDAKDREETKRLVYVALTRARDRLYLSSSLKDTKAVPARGSLGEVLPPSLLQALAGFDFGFVEWRAASGAVHRMRRCEHPGPNQPSALVTTSHLPVTSDFALMEPGRRPSRTVGDMAAAEPARPFAAAEEGERLAGVMLHLLLQRHGFGATREDLSREPALGELRTIDPAAAATALEAYGAICDHPDVRDLRGAVERLHEIPFTMRLDGTIVRGTIDCLVRTAPDRVVVLEFKTGRRQPEHQAQLDLYRQAAQRLFPDVAVEARLVYAMHGSPTS